MSFQGAGQGFGHGFGAAANYKALALMAPAARLAFLNKATIFMYSKQAAVCVYPVPCVRFLRKWYMTEKIPDFANMPEAALRRLRETLAMRGVLPTSYDPEMLYVECQVCGKPVLWEPGKTTELLMAAGVDVRHLDERCMILSEGCPFCAPYAKDGYTLAVVRIAGLTPEEALHMGKPGGTA